MAKRPDVSVPGIVVVDKPAGLTSHDVVARVRRLARTRKVGHGGTLDPMATGVLVVGVGKATRLLTWITGHDKTYCATIRFGATTSTDDAEGEIVSAPGCPALDPEALETAMAALRGDILQVPSTVSAKKIDGKRAYALAREGVEVELVPVPVTIARFESVSEPREAILPTDGGEVRVVDLDVEVDCSSGTYIRALARDLGVALGVGAHLTRLRRTRVGTFTLDDAHALADLEAEGEARVALSRPTGAPAASESDDSAAPASSIDEPAPAPGLIGLDAVVAAMFPTLELDEDEAARFLHGNPPRREPAEIAALAAGSATLGALDRAGHALGLLDASGPRLTTVCVLRS
ncbi:tRNA pseudouridine(55) synthase TruB [Actinomyces culturomici]|uniref:tRNA pseudouridine(55) synthase TruB n=1 Tax=Actinomyces culturomici TaxID=1926276 RepID=UPI000E1FCD77|nr:tRNA pseudouridine(55) synthase TruB [Actinomyces culturomici]